MQNPFSDFKTNEMSIEKIQEFFTTPQFIDNIYTPNAMFITGQRGCGKTMFMRYVENNPRIKDDKVEYVGIYLRFDRLVYGSQAFCDMESELFLHHLIITLLQRLVNRLSFLDDKYGVKLERISEFAEVICTTFFDEKTKCNTLEEVSKYLEKQRSSTMMFVRNPKRVKMPLICDYSYCFARVAEQLQKERLYSNITLLFLLDEYENLNSKHRQAVNGLIKSASYGYTFKVFHRPILLDTQVLDSEEHLMEQHDIMATDFYDEIIGGDIYYPGFMSKLVGKRLQLYYDANNILYDPEDLDIKKYLLAINVNEEFDEIQKKRNCVNKIKKSLKELVGNDNEQALDLIDELSNDVFKLRLLQSMIEKRLGSTSKRYSLDRQDAVNQVVGEFRSHSKRYKGWIENYRHAILYLLCFENQCKKQTAGWEQILSISSGIVRHVINILHYTFAKDSPGDGKQFKCFSTEEQTEAVSAVAKKLYEDIIHVPVVGKAELAMIQYYGMLFQLCHKDTTIKKWEVNHFVICKQGDQFGLVGAKQDKVDNVLDAAITWGHILKRKATKAKSFKELSANLSEYQIHPLLSVYFGVSWRRKQRYDTTHEEVYVAAYEENLRQAYFKNAAKKILGDYDEMKINLDELYAQQMFIGQDFNGAD